MCNLCNTGASTFTNGCPCGCWNGNQRVWRDGCGNLRVYTTTGCGWFNTCTGNQTCGCHCCNRCGVWNCGNQTTNNGTTTTNDDTTTTNNGNGFYCLTRCHRTAQTATTATDGDAYYARQYGLTNRRCGCPCGGNWTL